MFENIAEYQASLFVLIIFYCHHHKYQSLILDPDYSVLKAGDLVVQLHHAQEPAVDHQPPVDTHLELETKKKVT